jgi:hypothetical protein
MQGRQNCYEAHLRPAELAGELEDLNLADAAVKLKTCNCQTGTELDVYGVSKENHMITPVGMASNQCAALAKFKIHSVSL